MMLNPFVNFKRNCCIPTKVIDRKPKVWHLNNADTDGDDGVMIPMCQSCFAGDTIKKLFVAFPLVVTSTGLGGFMVVCVFVMTGTPEGSTESGLWRSDTIMIRG